jgi:hypothetical protein
VPWWLQWGRDLKIAEICAVTEFAATTARLQWGRDLKIAEMRSGLAATRQLVPASMGPRSEDRGNLVPLQAIAALHGTGRFNGAAI